MKYKYIHACIHKITNKEIIVETWVVKLICVRFQKTITSNCLLQAWCLLPSDGWNASVSENCKNAVLCDFCAFIVIYSSISTAAWGILANKFWQTITNKQQIFLERRTNNSKFQTVILLLSVILSMLKKITLLGDVVHK